MKLLAMIIALACSQGCLAESNVGDVNVDIDENNVRVNHIGQAEITGSGGKVGGYYNDGVDIENSRVGDVNVRIKRNNVRKNFILVGTVNSGVRIH